MRTPKIDSVVAFAERRPWSVLALAIAITTLFAAFASRTLEVQTGLLELLPEDSRGLQEFRAQRSRALGGSSLVIVVESPSPEANRRFVDVLAKELPARLGTDPRVAYIETGTAELRRFYDEHKWLYATLDELEEVDAKIDHTVARQSGLVEDLEGASEAAPTTSTSSETPRGERFGVREEWERWKRRSVDKDPYPTGYFATSEGTLYGLRVVTTLGLGDPRGDALVADVRALITSLQPKRFDARLAVGLTGELATTSTEKTAILDDALWSTLLAAVLILAGIAIFFRSIGALAVIGLPAAFGVAAAYAFAAVVYGQVNMVGAFLGAIILGNGINYPIVLLARYGDFRGRGTPGKEARVEAVRNAFRAELVGALVAAIAYGSLSITDFRGFRQFGVVGFVGMLVVWISIVPIVPALIVLFERHEARLPTWLGLVGVRRARGPWLRRLGEIVTTHPRLCLGLGAAITIAMVSPLPRFLADPWEYDFGRLGSRHSDVHAFGWSDKADRIFGKGDIAGAMILADTAAHAPELEARILERDRADPKGPLLHDIVTLSDYLPGSLVEQRAKLDVLDRIRDRLGPGVIERLASDERDLARDLRPPSALAPVDIRDVPIQLARRFQERDGRVGTVLYVQPRGDVALADGHVQLRLASTCDDVALADGTVVHTASNATIISEILKSLKHDGPLASMAALGAVALVVIVATRDRRGCILVLGSLVVGLAWMLGVAAWTGERFNYVNFIAVPITCGIGSEYAFNLFDRARLLGGDPIEAVARSGGAVLMCSFTTVVGYGALAYSDVQALESFGRLAVTGEIGCVVAALLLLPAGLSFMRKRASAQRSPWSCAIRGPR